MAGQGSVKKALFASADSFAGKLDPEHYERGDGKKAEDVVIECALKSDLADLVLTDRRVEFSEDVRTSFHPNPELDALFDLEMPMKINLTARTLIIKEYLTTVTGARACAADNSLDDTLFRDVILVVVLVYLRAAEVIAPNSTRPIKDPQENTESLMDDTFMRNWRVVATRVAITTLFVFCQGPVSETLRWYESYADVYGAFITEARLIDVCNLIFNTRSLVILCQKISLGDIEGLNNVLKYRAERLSSPALVLSALRVIEGTPLMAFVNPVAVSEYKKFYEGGMAAQIASGPLKAFCVGKINALETKNISKEVKIAELAPIDEPPFDVRLLKQAKMILETYEIPHGQWYQGEKALKCIEFRDTAFKIKLRAMRDAQKEAMKDAQKAAAQKEAMKDAQKEAMKDAQKEADTVDLSIISKEWENDNYKVLSSKIMERWIQRRRM